MSFVRFISPLFKRPPMASSGFVHEDHMSPPLAMFHRTLGLTMEFCSGTPLELRNIDPLKGFRTPSPEISQTNKRKVDRKLKKKNSRKILDGGNSALVIGF